jgi:hypothetical protein
MRQKGWGAINDLHSLNVLGLWLLKFKNHKTYNVCSFSSRNEKKPQVPKVQISSGESSRPPQENELLVALK